jgi:hypothetical protein
LAQLCHINHLNLFYFSIVGVNPFTLIYVNSTISPLCVIPALNCYTSPQTKAFYESYEHYPRSLVGYVGLPTQHTFVPTPETLVCACAMNLFSLTQRVLVVHVYIFHLCLYYWNPYTSPCHESLPLSQRALVHARSFVPTPRILVCACATLPRRTLSSVLIPLVGRLIRWRLF